MNNVSFWAICHIFNRNGQIEYVSEKSLSSKLPIANTPLKEECVCQIT